MALPEKLNEFVIHFVELLDSRARIRVKGESVILEIISMKGYFGAFIFLNFTALTSGMNAERAVDIS